MTRGARRGLAAALAMLGLAAGCGAGAGAGAGDQRGAPAALAAGTAARSTRAATPAPGAARHTPRHGAARRAAHRRAAASAARCGATAPPPERQIASRRWLSGVIVTEYYPVPERWFAGRLVPTPGLPGRHRVDWLYSARGVSMEGDGVDSAGRQAHIHDLGSVGWVNAGGAPTVPPRCGIRWSGGAPYWRAGGWRNRSGAVTYPLSAGGWSAGAGRWSGDYGGATFAPGPSLPLRYYRSVAVDPRLIPEGSRLYIPDYRSINGGWFVAQDTGGAIIGRHIDVYRPPTSQPFGSGRLLTAARVYVIPPGR